MIHILKIFLCCCLLFIHQTRATGVYIGINLGIHHIFANLNSKFEIKDVGTDTQLMNCSHTGYETGILLGIKKEYHDSFFATEIYAEKNNLSSNNAQEKQFSDINIDGPNLGYLRFKNDMEKTFGLGILTGTMIKKHFRPFVSLDILISSFKLTSTLIRPEPSATITQRKYLMGIAPGIGIEYNFNKNFTGRIAYKVSIYQKCMMNKGNFDEDVKINTSFRPINHSMKLSLIYNF